MAPGEKRQKNRKTSTAAKGKTRLPPNRVTCSCCGRVVSKRTEQRHRQGQSTPHINARTTPQYQSLSVSESSNPRNRHRPQPSSPSTPRYNSGPSHIRSSPTASHSPGAPVAEDYSMDDQPDDSANPVYDSDEEFNQRHHRVHQALKSLSRDIWLSRDYVDIGSGDEQSDTDEEVDDNDLGWDFDFDDVSEGLSPEESLGEAFEREFAATEAKLNPHDLPLLRAYNLKIHHNLTDEVFEDLPNAFPSDNIPTLDDARSRLQFLSGITPERYDCCWNSCCAFVGPHEDLDECPYCQEPRHRRDGKPRKVFTYLPLIPRLIAFYENADMAEKMQYRALEHHHEAGKVTDVFDGSVYQNLLDRHVEVDNHVLGHKYFSDPRDAALGIATDGVGPFKHRKSTAWPILIFLYNLHPEFRFLLKYILSVGVVPGPKKPIDMDSFLWPLVQEALKLLYGVRAFDALTSKLFVLRAYFILAFGDIPAISLIMRMKGHNGLCPCRMCRILAVPIRIAGRKPTLYVPLDRSNHPDVLRNPSAIQKYDPANLPLRTHEGFMSQAHDVQFAPSQAAADRLSKECGVKGIPILSYLPSLSFPLSFPYDFMHLIWENLIPNLIKLWTGEFKGLDDGLEEYHLSKTVWDAIGVATANIGSTVPYVFGARPPNIAKMKSFSAEIRSFWTLYIGPVLLRRQFKQQKYYDHFITLVELLAVCLQFEISSEEIQLIRDGFIRWVEEYESIYYQFTNDRLSTCPITIHALLHIADSIEATGPVWAAWAFPIERYCGTISSAVKSRRFPWASIDRRIIEVAQITQVKLRYDLEDELRLRKPKGDPRGQFSDPDYPTCVLLPPRCTTPLSASLLNKIVISLSTRFNQSMAAVRKLMKTATIDQWGKVRRLNGGDTMDASTVVSQSDDGRDKSYVRYEMLVDKNAEDHDAESDFELQTFYGQLQHIFVVHLPSSRQFQLDSPSTLILAAIKTCIITSEDRLDMHQFSQMGRLEVVDITCVQCIVGRIQNMENRDWTLIDRSGNMARAVFDTDKQ